MYISDFLLNKDILVKQNKLYYFKEKSEENLLKQIKIINYLHNILSSYGIGKSKLPCKIGKLVEGINVNIKLCRMQLSGIYMLRNRNKVDNLLLEYGEKILERGQQTIIDISNIDYLGIVKRAMDKNEICIGNPSIENIIVMDKIEIGSIKGLSYNLVEEDIYKLLKDSSRENPNYNYDNLLSKYIEISNLKEESYKYIEILLNYPLDFFKEWKKYKKKSRGEDIEKYYNNLKIALDYEIRKEIIK